jgi:hypothetical protein
MKKIFRFNSLLLVLTLLLFSCKKDYVNDGGTADPHVNMTTYDFLKSKPQFSSLVKLIERAGLKDAVNGNVTFFATTNYGVDEYLKAMKNIRAIELNNENITYTLDSIPLWRLDSLKTYLFDGKINREQMTVKGKYYPSQFGPITGVQFRINLDRVFGYTNYVDYVDYVVYSKVIGTLDSDELDPKKIPPDQVDKASYCQTSGIITTNGIVHVLDGYHRLFFNNDDIK